jgi:hypothetical protein
MTPGVCSCLGKQLSRHSVLKQQIRHTSSTHDRCLLAISIELPLYRNVFSIASYSMLCIEGLQGVRKIHLRQRTTRSGRPTAKPRCGFERGTVSYMPKLRSGQELTGFMHISCKSDSYPRHTASAKVSASHRKLPRYSKFSITRSPRTRSRPNSVKNGLHKKWQHKIDSISPSRVNS